MSHLIPSSVPAPLTALFLFTWTAMPSAAYQPQQSLGPEDVGSQRAWSDFSSDWSETDQFDLGASMELQVTLEAVEIPHDGALALVIFTLELPPGAREKVRGHVSHRYFATLQIPEVTARQGFTRRSFAGGSSAVLRGWAPTGRNLSGSMMLVNEIELSNGRIYRFHGDNPRMNKKHR